MKSIALSLIFLIACILSSAQKTSWKAVSVNNVLTFSLPADFKSAQSSVIKAFGGEIGSNFYGLQYYDSTFQTVENENQFRISLMGFISGRSTDSMLKGYKTLVTDTSFGGTVGLMAIYSANDASKIYKQIYYYVTLANNHYYWFYAYASSVSDDKNEISYFFKSIKFESEKLKERKFKLIKIHLQKDTL